MSGGRASDRSRYTSASAPPEPNSRTGPNWGSIRLATASSIAAGPDHRLDRDAEHVALPFDPADGRLDPPEAARTASASPRPSADAAHLGLAGDRPRVELERRPGSRSPRPPRPPRPRWWRPASRPSAGRARRGPASTRPRRARPPFELDSGEDRVPFGLPGGVAFGFRGERGRLVQGPEGVVVPGHRGEDPGGGVGVREGRDAGLVAGSPRRPRPRRPPSTTPGSACASPGRTGGSPRRSRSGRSALAGRGSPGRRRPPGRPPPPRPRGRTGPGRRRRRGRRGWSGSRSAAGTNPARRPTRAPARRGSPPARPGRRRPGCSGPGRW